MKKVLHLIGCSLTLCLAATITGCSNEDEPFADFDTAQSRMLSRSASESSTEYTIDFEDYEDMGTILAGPTSYGANLYASFTGTKFTEGGVSFGTANGLFFGINEINGAYNFWNGGVALSNWAIMKNQSTSQANDWWYSYNNQCSVYNKDALGDQEGAGADGSDVFAIIYGYQDSHNQSYMKLPELTFAEPVSLKSLEYCNSSYVYGVLENGNQFGDSIIVTVPQLKQDKGYFQVTLYCYDSNDNLIAQRSKFLADYQEGHPEVKPVCHWTLWDLTEGNEPINNVQKIKFNFTGSDNSAYGLNTPAYICVDNITVSY